MEPLSLVVSAAIGVLDIYRWKKEGLIAGSGESAQEKAEQSGVELSAPEKCEEIIANPDIQGAHDKNKEFIGNNCYNFT